MKAAVIAGPGQAPQYADFDEPPAADGRQLVEVVAAGIHPLVRSLASGRHYGSSGIWPMIPGVDAVARTADGTLVYTGFPVPPYGTLAERLSVPGGTPLPAGADPVRVAAGVNPGLSSWLPLQAELAGASQPGTVLVLGATGMAGLLAVQNALLLGARHVVAAGRSEAGLARAGQYGAAALARLTGAPDADARAITAALGGSSPSVVLDYLWGGPAEAAFAALGGAGLDEDPADISYIHIGAMAGGEARLPSALLRSRRITVRGSGAGSIRRAEIMKQLPVYLGRIADGSVQVPARAVPLSAVASGWAAAAAGGDRVVIVPG